MSVTNRTIAFTDFTGRACDGTLLTFLVVGTASSILFLWIVLKAKASNALLEWHHIYTISIA